MGYLTSAYLSISACLRLYQLLLSGLLLLLVSSGSLAATSPQNFNQFVYSQLQTGFSQLSASSRQLNQRWGEYCDNSQNAPSFASLQASWRELMDHWQQVQWAQFGPLKADNAHWRLQFWPDKKNLVGQRIGLLLKQEQPVTQTSIYNGSVVTQGLGAVELLLFDANFQPQVAVRSSKHCELGSAVIANLTQVSQTLAQGWQQITASDLQLSELVQALLSHLETLKVDKLGKVLGGPDPDAVANGYFAESWRSGHSLANIQHNLLALQAVFNPSAEPGLVALLQASGQKALAQQLTPQLTRTLTLCEQALKTLAVSSVSPHSLLGLTSDKDLRHQVQALYRATGELNQIMRSQLPQALNIQMGFNANDGD